VHSRRRRCTATVTWKPQLAEVTAMPKTTLVFDSSKIPGEILDLMVVNSATLKANPKLGKALVGAWYETLTLMPARTRRPPPRSNRWPRLGHRPRGLQGQLATTYLYANAAAAVAAPGRRTSSRR
jgi:NitT/TauT family transport system substrate-binding protein